MGAHHCPPEITGCALERPNENNLPAYFRRCHLAAERRLARLIEGLTHHPLQHFFTARTTF